MVRVRNSVRRDHPEMGKKLKVSEIRGTLSGSILSGNPIIRGSILAVPDF